MNRSATVAKGLAIALASVGLAFWSASFSYVNLTKSAGPIGAKDPVALNARSSELVPMLATQAEAVKQIKENSLVSLKLQALNPTALALLAMVQPSQNSAGDNSVGNKLLELSSSLSRRDLLTHISNIERYVARDDVKNVLRSYDLALTTSSESQKILFPILGNAIGDEKIRSALVPYFKRGAPWLGSFMNFSVTNSVGIDALGVATAQAGGFGPRDKEYGMINVLIGSLVSRGHYALAKENFLRSRKGGSNNLVSVALSDANFSKGLGAMAWQLNEQPEFGASKVAGGGLVYYAAPNARGVVAQKLLFLNPGSYEVLAEVGKEERPSGMTARWLMQCLSASPNQTGGASQSIVSTSDAGDSVVFSVEKGCFAQSLQLAVAGSDSQDTAQARIGALKIRSITSEGS